ncbi:hypothetical protein [Luteolibacter sp. LG18]|uniref:hypothetical protein n=1 Tax=Luteolibacter sp. LG18 TaxID=2819286 RepID=UPI002B2875F7|nr:hypothetical protein llg_45390 [Luteolibacter sp. LG18]
MTDPSEPQLAPLPVPRKRPRFPLGRACALSSLPGVAAVGVVLWMAFHHHAHFRIPLIRGLEDWIYWPLAGLFWFVVASGIPLLASFVLWVASHLTPQP